MGSASVLLFTDRKGKVRKARKVNLCNIQIRTQSKTDINGQVSQVSKQHINTEMGMIVSVVYMLFNHFQDL